MVQIPVYSAVHTVNISPAGAQVLVFVGCMAGFYGVNCTKTCRYPSYGTDCQQKCYCAEYQCYVIIGCVDIGG